MTRIVTFVLIGAIGLGAYAWLAKCGSDEALQERIAAEVAKGAGTVVVLEEHTDFAWETVHLFDPYATVASIESSLGFRWSCAERTGIANSDGITLLVFVKDGAVVRYVRQPRNKGDFAGIPHAGPLTPSEAVFVVRARKDGVAAMALR